MDKIFTVGISVSGNFNSSYVFESESAADTWLDTVFQDLIHEYGELRYSVCDLPGLKVGDRCNVFGDGDEVYVIEGLKQYSPNRYGFILDSGFCEEVYKCHTNLLGNCNV